MKLNTLFFLTITVIFLVLAGDSDAQVKIPANSAKSLDSAQKTTTSALPPVNRPAFTSSSNISRVQQPATLIAAQKATITSSSQTVKDPKIDGSKVLAIQRVEIKRPPQSVGTIKRLSELRRELNIAESAARARITLPADDLFEDADPVIIDKFAEPALKRISEYLRLTDKKKINVTSFYAPDQDNGKALAWSRSLSLIEWLEDKGGLSADNINSARPAPLEAESVKEFPNTEGETEFQNRIVLNLE